MKKFLFVFTFIVTIIPIVQAQDVNRHYVYENIDGLWYYLYDDYYTADLAKIPSDFSGRLDIPAYVEFEDHTYKLTAIEGGACKDTNITSVTIPQGVTSIGWYSFGECPELEDVSLPIGLEFIDDCAFAGSAKLRSIVLPEGLTHLGSAAFEGCTALTSVEFPSTLADINNYAFMDCVNLRNVNIPPTVQRIGWMTFDNCISFTKIDIPEGVKILDTCCFNNCENVESISIPSSITTMGNEVFHCCDRSSLKSVVSHIQNPFKIDGFSFFEYSYIAATLYVPKGTRQKYENMYAWNCFRNIQEVESAGICDANADGTVNAVDIIAIANFITGNAGSMTMEQADVNGDGVVNVADIVAIINVVVGKE